MKLSSQGFTYTTLWKRALPSALCNVFITSQVEVKGGQDRRGEEMRREDGMDDLRFGKEKAGGFGGFRDGVE